MPPSAKAPLVDQAFCERTCRVATALGWTLQHDHDPLRSLSHLYVFHARNGRKVTGAPFADQAAALTSACRFLAEKLV